MLDPRVTSESLEALPEVLRAEYKADPKEEGVFVLDVAEKDGYALEYVAGLKSALAKEKQAAKDFSSKLKSYEGIDPTEVSAWKTELEELRQIDPTKEADKVVESRLKSLQAQMDANYQKDLGSKDARIGTLEKHLHQIYITDAAKSAIREAGGDEGTVNLLMPHIVGELSIQELEGGGFATQVRDAEGNPRIGKGTNMMTPRERVEEMKNNLPWAAHAFPGSGRSGSGTPPNQQQGGKPSVDSIKIDELTSIQKAKLMKDIGREAFFELKAKQQG